MKFTLYTATCTGNPQNSIYPVRVDVSNAEDMAAAVAKDHVCASYQNAHRSIDNYLGGDVDVMDCDNDHTDHAEDWITPEMYEDIFPDVSYVVVPSRNNMKQKGGKSARPRHHVYFPHIDTFLPDECAALKRSCWKTITYNFLSKEGVRYPLFFVPCVEGQKSPSESERKLHDQAQKIDTWELV